MNGDGHADVLAGAAGARGTGFALVYSGADGATLLELAGEAAGDAFGRRVAGAGDLDGDGRPDLVVGAPGHDAAGADAGRAYVVSGATGRVLLALDGEAPGDAFGSCVDGWSGPDARLVIVGAKDAGPGDRGRVYVYRVTSAPESESRSVSDSESSPAAAPHERASRERRLAAELAFTIDPAADDVDLGRMFVSAVGDVDGAVDVYASDWASDAGGVRGAGRVYVHSGRTGERLFTFAGTRPGEGFGIGTAEAGDADGDGHADLLVGAWQNAEGAPSAGECTLYSGGDGRVLATYTCTNAGDTFEVDTTGLGDLDGDGRLDFLVTAAYSPVHGPKTGRIVILAGPMRSKAEGPEPAPR